MSDFEWYPKLGDSWSFKHEPTKLGIIARDTEFASNHRATMVVALLQEPMDLEGGSPMNLEGGFPRNLEEDFLPGYIQSKIQESDLAKL